MVLVPAEQPPVVRIATVLIVASGVLTIVESVSTIRNVGSFETVDSLNKMLSMGWGKSAHLSITTLQETLRVSANVAAVLAGATAVLAIFAGRGSRQSRTALAVLALPLLLASLTAAGYAGVGMVIGIGLLWSRNAQPWFAVERSAAPAPSPAPSPSVAAPAPTPPSAPAAPSLPIHPGGAPTPPMPAPVM